MGLTNRTRRGTLTTNRTWRILLIDQMTDTPNNDPLRREALAHFAEMVESVGVKSFANALGLSTRQINRILAGSQPNPIERFILCLQGAKPEAGDGAIDYICQELGGHFVRHEAMDTAAVNAVKECAEAIAAISDGQISDLDIKEVREAISALSGLIMSINRKGPNPGPPENS